MLAGRHCVILILEDLVFHSRSPEFPVTITSQFDFSLEYGIIAGCPAL